MTTATTSYLPGALNLYHPLPAPGDIILCRFPYIFGVPGPKDRPVLVIATSPSTHEVKVCFGTSQKTDQLYPGEFLISYQDAGFVLSGLSYSTKFDMTRTANLPFDDVWFVVVPGMTTQVPAPKLGTMHPSYYPIASAAAKVRTRTP